MLNFFLQATPHVNPSATPAFNPADYQEPAIWPYALGVVVVLFLVGYFITGFRNPFKK